MLAQLLRSLRDQPAASVRPSPDMLSELLAFPQPELRALFVSNYQHHGRNLDYEARRRETEIAHAAAFAGDPLPLALDLLAFAPRWKQWHDRQPIQPGLAWLDGAFWRALDEGRRLSIARHGGRLPISADRLAGALQIAAQLVAEGDHGFSDGGAWLEPLVHEAAARNDAASRTALISAVGRLLAAEPHHFDSAATRVEKILPSSGLARHHVPALIALDRRRSELDEARARVSAILEEPLATALMAVLDNDRAATALSLPEAVKHPAMRALADLSPEKRGAAFHRLLSWLMENTARFDSVGWNAVQKRSGRYQFDIVNPDVPVQVGNLLGVLASRKIDLVNPDDDIAAFLQLLHHFPLLGYKRVIELVLATVTAHPGGRASATLRIALEDKRVLALRDFRIQAEDTLRAMPAPTYGRPGAFGRKSPGDPPRAPVVSPLALPNLVLDDWNAYNVLSRHFDNLFDVRLYDASHLSLLARLASVTKDMAALSNASPEIISQIGQRWSDLPMASDRDQFHQAHAIAKVVTLAADLDARFRAMAPFVTAYPAVARQLGRLATDISTRSTPTAKWLAEGNGLLSPIPPGERLKLLQALAATPTPAGSAAVNNDQLRTLIFLSADLDPTVIGPLLAEYALKRCYVTEAYIGIRSEKVGNACLWTLAALSDGAGVPFLARVLSRTKYPKIKAKVDARLNEAAAAAGIDRGTLDELTVPTHDLDYDGRRAIALDGGTATLRIVDGRHVTIDWATVDDRPLKAPSIAMKTDTAALKAVRTAAKELEADLGVQPLRFQRLYLQDRCWPAAVWRERYLDHPLLRSLATRLIWSVDHAGTTTAALPHGDTLLNVEGQAVAMDGATVRLWHPVAATGAEIEAWRDRLETLQLTQPFAQAWREVYALTDAERSTGTYSNRWAAHLLKQHQAMTLARLNGWRVTHRVAFDTPNDQPWHLAIPAHHLVADYWIEGTGGDDPETTESGAYAYVSTDRIQFHEAKGADSARGPVRGRAVPLVELPAIVFSEVMRQADLFTAVASIAADPNWLDRGGDAAHPSQWDHTAIAYWQHANGAELAESGKRRQSMLARIIPRLKIAPRLVLDERYLSVQGTRHRYRIHLGSGACFRGERHICIVPAQERVSSKVWLPFEGDRTLSIILSKAALLANDDKITDPVILAQL